MTLDPITIVMQYNIKKKILAKATSAVSEYVEQLKKVLVPISKGKAVYTCLVRVKPTKPAENSDEKEKDASSYEPV